MRVYEATVIDKCAGAEPISYESHIVVDDKNDGTKATDWDLFYKDLERETGFTDEEIFLGNDKGDTLTIKERRQYDAYNI